MTAFGAGAGRVAHKISSVNMTSCPPTIRMADERRSSAGNQEKSGGALNAQFVGHSDQIGKPLGVQLGHQLIAMDLPRDLAQSYFGGDLLVKKARRYQRQYLAFPRAQAFVSRVQFTVLQLC